MSLDRIARAYVNLAFSLNNHDQGYVDLYFGPPELRDLGEEPKSLAAIRADAQRLLSELSDVQTINSVDAREGQRARWLGGQLKALIARVAIVQGIHQSFDDETLALYGLVAPTFSDDFFEAILRRIDSGVPGRGPLEERYRSFRQRFTVPSDKLPATLSAALSMSRARTRDAYHLDLDEDLSVQYVSGKPWSGYLWYHGDYHSTFELNTDAPLRISDVLDLACHEGYPGHHIQFCLADQILFRERGWVEFTVSTLYTPRRLFYDGCATYAVHLVLPGDEQRQFERDVLFPCAGLDSATASEFHEIYALTRQLWPASVEAGRRLLDGLFDEAACVEYLQRYALMSRAGADMHIAFYRQFRSAYVQYVLGYDIVRRLIDATPESDSTTRPATRWQRFQDLLLSPGL